MEPQVQLIPKSKVWIKTHCVKQLIFNPGQYRKGKQQQGKLTNSISALFWTLFRLINQITFSSCHHVRLFPKPPRKQSLWEITAACITAHHTLPFKKILILETLLEYPGGCLEGWFPALWICHILKHNDNYLENHNDNYLETPALARILGGRRTCKPPWVAACPWQGKYPFGTSLGSVH